MLKSLAKPQKLCDASPCEIVFSGSEAGVTLSFTETKNVTLTLYEGLRLHQKLGDVLEQSTLTFTRLHKVGTGRSSIGPALTGVSIARLNVPAFDADGQLTLEYIGVDGQIVSVYLCHNGQERHKVLEHAKHYL